VALSADLRQKVERIITEDRRGKEKIWTLLVRSIKIKQLIVIKVSLNNSMQCLHKNINDYILVHCIGPVMK